MAGPKNIAGGSGRVAMLHAAAEKELTAELAMFEASMYRRDDQAMQNHRERAQAILDTILDLKHEQWVLLCRENGLG